MPIEVLVTIHSGSQLSQLGICVDDKPRAFGDLQRLKTLDGYFIPPFIHDGCGYFDLFPPTDEEFSTNPHVFFTGALLGKLRQSMMSIQSLPRNLKKMQS
jgi:hypothetical protein